MDRDTMFWVCVFMLCVDVFLAAIAPMPELRTVFLLSGACFVVGALVNYREFE